MSTLYPTPTRLALLRAAAAEQLWNEWNGSIGHRSAHRWIWRSDEGSAVVDAKAREMIGAGWLRCGAAKTPSMYSPRRAELTESGRAVLDANGGAR